MPELNSRWSSQIMLKQPSVTFKDYTAHEHSSWLNGTLYHSGSFLEDLHASAATA